MRDGCPTLRGRHTFIAILAYRLPSLGPCPQPPRRCQSTPACRVEDLRPPGDSVRHLATAIGSVSQLPAGTLAASPAPPATPRTAGEFAGSLSSAVRSAWTSAARLSSVDAPLAMAPDGLAAIVAIALARPLLVTARLIA